MAAEGRRSNVKGQGKDSTAKDTKSTKKTFSLLDKTDFQILCVCFGVLVKKLLRAGQSRSRGTLQKSAESWNQGMKGRTWESRMPPRRDHRLSGTTQASKVQCQRSKVKKRRKNKKGPMKGVHGACPALKTKKKVAKPEYLPLFHRTTHKVRNPS